ncbi:hypothetical protein Btru_022502 [Bulinus truncatus]|nr:hypothetical protein Btru_022502 [Bulinus truncatus]
MTNSLILLYATTTLCVTLVTAFTINSTSGATDDPQLHYGTTSTEHTISTPSTVDHNTTALYLTNDLANENRSNETNQPRNSQKHEPTLSISTDQTTNKPKQSNTTHKIKRKPLQSISTDKTTQERKPSDTSDDTVYEYLDDYDTTEDPSLDDDDEEQSYYREQQNRYYHHLYVKFIERVPGMVGNGPRQPTTRKCIRKEYRMLTVEERNRFNKAIHTLKQDTSVSPNKYDALAIVHSGPTLDASHRGPGFLGWHRIYLKIFETALQEVDPDVCLSFWDTTIESQLDEPWLSSLWSSELLGSPEGAVINGPFANWTTPENKPLSREVGQDGLLFTPKIIHDILSRARQEDITTSKKTKHRFDLESFHEGVHSFSGGAMKIFATAAFDPTFYLLHTFIDYVWSLFRAHLKREGVDPEKFPNVSDVNFLHEADAPTGFGNLTHSDGFLEALAQSVTYIPSPHCSSDDRNCHSRLTYL